MSADPLVWLSWNRGEIRLRFSDIEAMTHQGQCDEDVREVSKLPYVRAQLDKLDKGEIRRELREYGAWDAEELADEDQNEQRFLWTLAGNFEGQYPEGVDSDGNDNREGPDEPGSDHDASRAADERHADEWRDKRYGW